MVRFIVSFVLVISAAVLTSAQETETPVEAAFHRGALAMHNGHAAEAEADFREAVRLAPQMAEAHLDLGLVLGRNGKLDEAIQSLQTAIRLDPKINSAHMFLGIFLSQENRQQEAIDALQQELALNPDNVEALTWLGTVELAVGSPEEAVAPLDHAAKLKPDDLDILDERGRAHDLVARDSYARMARINPDSWHVHRVRAELYAGADRDADAITEYLAATRLEPRNPDLFVALGEEYRKTSQLDLAQKAFAQAVQLSPHNSIAVYDLGSTDIELGKYSDGVPLLQTMLASYTNAPVAEYYLGRGLAALNQNDEALQWLQKSIHDDPTGEVAKRSYFELARLYRRLKRPEDSEKAMAAYNRLREAADKQNAKQLQDWRKFNGQPSQSAQDNQSNP